MWDYGARTRTTANGDCVHRSTRKESSTNRQLRASDGVDVVRVALAAPSSDLPDRLVVRQGATGRRIASWPLVERPAHVAVYGGLAILSGAHRSALYVLRIADGRIAQIGIARAGDRPVIGPGGVLYQDDLDLAKHLTAPADRTLNLLPLATVRHELSRPFSTVRMYMSYSTPAASGDRRVAHASVPVWHGAEPARGFTSPLISAMAMDGPRVALAIRDPRGQCDYVLFWNVSWHYVTRLTRYSGSTCLARHASGGITDVAIAGSRAIWTTTYGRETRILAASITGCVEWVVARPVGGSNGVADLSGDGITLAYAVRRLSSPQRQQASVGVVPRLWRGTVIDRTGGQVTAISANNRRVALLQTSGVARIVAEGRGPTDAIRVGPARAVSLRPRTVAVLTSRGTVNVYATPSNKRLHSWRVPPNSTSLDTQFGIALVTAGRDVFALNLSTGRFVRLLHAPGRVFAQIEAPGAAISFNTNGRGQLRFFPMSRLESQLGE
jgi:hypothetical protein